MDAPGEESGEDSVNGTESGAASRPVKEQQVREISGACENAETEGDKGFWLILVSILGVGVLGMAGLVIAHSIKKFD